MSSKTTILTTVTKDMILALRQKIFSSSLSISYANSGPLMIMEVSERK